MWYRKSTRRLKKSQIIEEVASNCMVDHFPRAAAVIAAALWRLERRKGGVGFADRGLQIEGEVE
jgi:hypothetical protein